MSALASWIFLGIYCGLFLIAFPLLVGFASRTARRAAILSTLSGLLGAAVVVGVVAYVRGKTGVPSPQVALFFFGASAAAASIVGWLAHRLVGFFRQESPLVASRKALGFLVRGAIRAALLYVVLSGVYIVAVVDLAEEIPYLMYLYLGASHYLYVGAAVIIGFAWIVLLTRRGWPSNSIGRASMQVIPASVAVLLALPILLASVQDAWSTPLLDCTPRGIPGYAPEMIDYTRLVLDALLAGALLGLRSVLGWEIATCVPLATSRIASCLVYGLNFAPVIFLALIAHRIGCLREPGPQGR